MATVIGLAGCAGGGQAPIESRTSGGVLASDQAARQSGGLARAGSAGGPSGAGALGSTTSAATPSRANAPANLDRPVSPSAAAEVGPPGMGAPIGGGSGIKSTPLVVETLRTPESGVPRGGSATTPPRLTAQPMPEPRLESRMDSRTPPPATPSSPAASGSLAPATSAPAASATTGSGAQAVASEAQTNWVWPAAGRVLQSFEPGKTKGMTLSGTLGDPVIAVADGKVIFSGQGPRGYGNLIIIKHPADLLSVYAHNRVVLVKEGASVVRGQRIAELGDTDSDRPKLHFEVRRQGRPIDPIQMLPGR